VFTFWPIRQSTGYEPGLVQTTWVCCSVFSDYDKLTVTMTTLSVRHQIRLLTEENFGDWLIDIRAHLRPKELWECTQIAPDDKESQKKTEQAADAMTPTISVGVKQKLIKEDFNDGYKMLRRLEALLQPSTDAEFMRLTKEYYTLSSADFKSTGDMLTHIKLLEERIDATKVTLDSDKRTILCLMMCLPEQYRSLVQIWSVTKDMTAEKARIMLLEEDRRQNHVDENQGIKSLRIFGNKSKERKQYKHCKRGFHTEAKCWKLHSEQASQWAEDKRDWEQEQKKSRDRTSGIRIVRTM